MHRTQVLLEEEQYQRLKRESERSGRSIGDLVRRAVAEKYADPRKEEVLSALRDSRGIAEADDFLGLSSEEYVAQSRSRWSSRLAERE